jgi:YesN/AraC family two-component response regulator
VLEENKFKSEKLLILTVANIMAEILKGRYEGELVLLEAGRFSLLVPNYSEAMLEELKDNIKRYLKLDVKCGISRAFDDIYPVHAAFVEANEALSFNFSKGERKIAYFDRLKIAPEIQSVADLIKEQYASNIKLSDLARSVGYSESYLSVLYKKETGETIMDSITRRRLEKAKELLKDKALKIYEISEAIGYSDPNYFGKFFKKAEGMYPQEYRKRYFNM